MNRPLNKKRLELFGSNYAGMSKSPSPLTTPSPTVNSLNVGVFYMPGWKSDSTFWNDIAPYPERAPLLGQYPEEYSWVSDWHLKWAIEHGIGFFIYDWFWLVPNGGVYLEHAIRAHQKSAFKDLVSWCIMWANHDPFIPNVKDVSRITKYWIQNYFNQPNYMKINNKPVVAVFLPEYIAGDPNLAKTAITGMKQMVVDAGYSGLLLIAIDNNAPSTSNSQYISFLGYDAYTPYNYINRNIKNAPYEDLMTIYSNNWTSALTASGLQYIMPATPGWDDTPWYGANAVVRTGSTPTKFKYLLQSAKNFMDTNINNPNINHDIILIEAWNEFAEGAYIEPTTQNNFGYIDAIRDVFTTGSPIHTDEMP